MYQIKCSELGNLKVPLKVLLNLTESVLAVRNVFEKSSELLSERIEGAAAEFVINTTRSQLENAFREARTKVICIHLRC